MLVLITALHCEARPLISRLKLRKDRGPGRFEMYRGEGVLLAVSGVGMIRSAAAVSHALALVPPPERSLAVNLGIAGCADKELPSGSPVLMNKIINGAEGRAYYPDILFVHRLLEGAVMSCLKPVSCGCPEIERGLFYDMEAAGFFEAASMFLPPHAVQCLKVVSDHLEGEKLEPGFVSVLLEQRLDELTEVIREAENISGIKHELLSAEDYAIIEEAADNLRLSETMKFQLIGMARNFRASGGGGLDLLRPYVQNRLKSKREGKKALDRIGAILKA